MEYYHNLITEKSWQELKALKSVADFVLIGGWAVYLYTKSLKSKDIDIIVDFDQLPILEKNYQLSKNERLSKYQARKEEIEIDIYLPHFSKLGVPVEVLIEQANNLEGFQVLKADWLLALKIYTLSERGRTAKGQKDFLDILALLLSKKIDLTNVKKILTDFNIKEGIKALRDFLAENSNAPELNLNEHRFSRLKKEITAFL